MLVLPMTQSSPSFPGQAVTDETDLWALSQAVDGTGVLSACQVTQDTGSDMKVAVAAGTLTVAGTSYSPSATGGSPLTVVAASATDRRDAVVYTVGTGYQVIEGTPASTGNFPVKPLPAALGGTIPANSCLLGEVYVSSSTTSITSNNIVDKTANISSVSSSVVAKTANYTFVTGDSGTYFTFNGSSLVATLPASAPSNGWHLRVLNLNATELEVTPQSLNMNGVAGPIYVSQYQVVDVYTDGSNYFYGFGTPSAGSLVTGSGTNGVALSVPSTTSNGLALALPIGTWLVMAAGSLHLNSNAEPYELQIATISGTVSYSWQPGAYITSSGNGNATSGIAMAVAVVTAAAVLTVNITVPSAMTGSPATSTGQPAAAFRIA